MKLDVLTAADCELVRQWRNADPSGLRTPYGLTHEQQEQFYRETVCNRRSDHRYYAIRGIAAAGEFLIGMGGLTNISWENGSTEISLIIDPALHGKGCGQQAARLLVREAFDRLRLVTVVGECYGLNTRAVDFWQRLTEEYHGSVTWLPRRKWWDGRLWDSLYFTIARQEAA